MMPLSDLNSKIHVGVLESLCILYKNTSKIHLSEPLNTVEVSFPRHCLLCSPRLMEVLIIYGSGDRAIHQHRKSMTHHCAVTIGWPVYQNILSKS